MKKKLEIIFEYMDYNNNLVRLNMNLSYMPSKSNNNQKNQNKLELNIQNRQRK